MNVKWNFSSTKFFCLQVPIPETLDLDEWINEANILTEEAESSSESDLSSVESDSQKRSNDYAMTNKDKQERRVSDTSKTGMKKRESESATIKHQRQFERENNPYYIKGAIKSQSSTTADTKNANGLKL